MAATEPRRTITDEERARISPAGLARLTVPDWNLLPVTNLLNRVFLHAAIASLRPQDRELDPWRRVILALPPRTGKSEICSVNGPAWYLGHNPDKMVGIASYEATFAEGWGALTRNVLQSFGARIFGTVTDPSSEAKNWWGTLDYRTGLIKRGGMRASGWEGFGVGKGFNLLVLDDLIKDAAMALSSGIREAQFNFWQSTAKTRLEPGGSAIIVMQRWHEDDIAGRVMREEGLFAKVGRGGWTPIIVPLRAEPITLAHVPGLEDGEELPDPLGRKPGEMLLTRFDPGELAERERTTDEFWWTAQYQQRPSARVGQLFKRDSLRYYEVLPDYYRLLKMGVHWLVPRDQVMVFVTTDLAASMKTRADYFTLGIWACTRQRDLLLLDVVRGRYEGPDQDEIIEGVYRLHRPAFVAIEGTAYQLTMVQRMRRKGLAIRQVNADRDKYSRAVVGAMRMNGEGIFLPAGPKPWKTEYINEHLNFPNAAHDDQVDMTAYAAITIEPRGAGGSANIRVVG